MPARLAGRRTVPALVLAGALVVSAGVGGATAGALITGRDIKDGSVTGADIAHRTLEARQLSDDAIAMLKTRWNSGPGAPTESGSRTGDWYLDTTTGDAYKRAPSGWELRVNIMGATGAPGAVGPQGAVGDTGATGAQGAKGDTGATGAKGDEGDKGDTGATGAKGDQGQQGDSGDAGQDGSVWLRGTTAPTAGLGAVGDWYLNTTTWDAYEKDAGGWVVVVNLRGPVGPKGDTGATGAAGATGATGAQGPQGTVGAAGATGATGTTGAAGAQGPQGPKGDTGSQGPQGLTGQQGIQGQQGVQGPPGGGVTLKDGNGTALGKVVFMDRTSVTFVTSAGYLMTTRWNGLTAPAQMYFTEACATGGASQGGSAYLNDGGVGGQPMLGKAAVFSGSFNSWVVPATVIDGYSTSVAFTAAAIDNPACGTSSGEKKGWLLRKVTAADLGLPAGGSAVNQFVLPLTAAY